MEPRKAVSIYMRPELLERVEAQAKFEGRSVSNYVEHFLDRLIPRDPREQLLVPRTTAEGSFGTDTGNE
jgi:hypothetical protein